MFYFLKGSRIVLTLSFFITHFTVSAQTGQASGKPESKPIPVKKATKATTVSAVKPASSTEINKVFFETSKFSVPVWLELPPESSMQWFQQISSTPDVYESGLPSTAITVGKKIEDYDPYLLSFLIKNNYARFETRTQTRHNTYSTDSKVYHFLFYSDDFKKNIQYFTVNDGLLQSSTKPFLRLAHRSLISIDYKNQYEDAPIGMKRTFYSMVFSYNLVNDLAGLPSLNKVFKGKGKAFLDPDDGTWKMTGPFDNLGVSLDDRGDYEYSGYFKANYQPYKFEEKAPVSKNVNTTTTTNTTPSNGFSKILISSVTGTTCKQYMAGMKDVYIDKKSNSKQSTQVIFLFPQPENQFLYQAQLISHFNTWINQSLNWAATEPGKFKTDSVFKIELLFSETFRPSVTAGQTFWYTNLETRIYITQNGKRLKDETFLTSNPFMGGKTDKWISLEDAIKKSEKKVGKILDDYMEVNEH